MRSLIFTLLSLIISSSVLATENNKAYFAGGCFWCMEESFEKNLISFEKLLENFWKNIDPFDSFGQFCDKGYSYRSVAFFTNEKEKDLIEKDIKKLEKQFNKKIVTYVRKFEKFYIAEDRHQNYYKEYLLNYLKYKKACRREEILNRIWKMYD